ncbi:hypothetical protein CMI38_01650 [Candidatus Pacearchaeota archaeon]|nr:hypothetical protein [Candidatus Pacearchaeota archaeon]|tara:strand:- start:263 stop:475 length:213 start_codon:yes stop_codon:yes gene_type:complete
MNKWIIVGVVVLLLVVGGFIFFSGDEDEIKKGSAVIGKTEIDDVSEDEFDDIGSTDEILDEIDESLEFFV